LERVERMPRIDVVAAMSREDGASIPVELFTVGFALRRRPDDGRSERGRFEPGGRNEWRYER